MKTILTLTLSIVLSLPYVGFSQRYKNKDIALISFSLTIHEDIKAYLNKFEDQFSNTSNVKADKIISLIKNQSWLAIIDSLQEGVGLSVLPISTFGNKSNFDEYNYPNIGISKAQQLGYSKYFIKIDLDIKPYTTIYQTNTKSNPNQTDKPKDGEIMPYVTLTLTCYSNNGMMPIGKFTGSSQASSIWKANDSSILDGLINSEYKNDQTTLMSLITKCLHSITLNMKAK